MGTSSNQSSPLKDPSWMAARVALANPAFPADRQSQEIWRAATSDTDASLQQRIGDALFAKAAELARPKVSHESAVDTYLDLVDHSSVSSIFTEIGKRALLRAVQSSGGPTAFASELFAETASYYISRDLPSLVGLKSRIASVTEALALKQTMTSLARGAATEVAKASALFEKSAPVSSKEWKSFVASVLTALTGQS
jgi:hypothetical protein